MDPNGYKPSPFYKQALLTVVALLGIVIFYHYDIYEYWYQERAKRNFNLMLEEYGEDLSEEELKQQGWGPAYSVATAVAKYFEENKIKNPTVLLEPNEYVNKTAGFKLPEPVVFYYFTGGKVKAVWASNKGVAAAQYILYIKPQGLSIQPIRNKEELNSILNTYKPYKDQL